MRDCGAWRRTGLLTAHASLSPEPAPAHTGPWGFYFRLPRSGACGERALRTPALSLRRHAAPPAGSGRSHWTQGAQGTVGFLVPTPGARFVVFTARSRWFRASRRLRAWCTVCPRRGDRGRGCVWAGSVGRAGSRGRRRRHDTARVRGGCPRAMCVGSARGAAICRICLHLRRVRVALCRRSPARARTHTHTHTHTHSSRKPGGRRQAWQTGSAWPIWLSVQCSSTLPPPASANLVHNTSSVLPHPDPGNRVQQEGSVTVCRPDAEPLGAPTVQTLPLSRACGKFPRRGECCA